MPHNPNKTLLGSLAFWIGGGFSAWILMLWNGAVQPPYSPGLLLVVALTGAFVCAFIESLPPTVDDNLLITWVAGVAFFLLFRSQDPQFNPLGDWRAALLITAAGLPIGLWLGWLTRPATILAATVGFLTQLTLGWSGLVTLACFLAIGSVLSGGASRGSDRRNWLSVFSKGLTPVLAGIAFAFIGESWLLLAFAGAVAAGACDTVATEVGVRLRGTTWMLRSLRRVPPGTPGGVSLGGTLAGSAAGCLLAAAPMLGGWYGLGGWALVSACGLAACLCESLMKAGPGEDQFREASYNIWNTFLGGFLAGGTWYLLTG